MNDDSGGFGNEEYKDSRNNSGRKLSPQKEFWMFFFIWGWVLPFGIIYGLIKSDISFVLGGVLAGGLLWWMFGIELLKDLFKK